MLISDESRAKHWLCIDVLLTLHFKESLVEPKSKKNLQYNYQSRHFNAGSSFHLPEAER